jgi:hypothetical protein
MTLEISRWPLTTGARVRARFSPRGICCEQSITGTGFSQSSLVFPCQFITPRLHTHSLCHLGDDQYARWWPQFRDTVSPHQHE